MSAAISRYIIDGNIVELSVAFVLGVAFVAIVNSFATDIVLPIIGALTGGIDFSGLSYTVGDARITYGRFIQTVFSFLIVALSVYLLLGSMRAAGIRKF